jgi:RecA-family ATPase
MKTKRDDRQRATVAPLDAWVLARVMANQPIDDEMAAAMSEGLRPLALGLAEVRHEQRPAALGGFTLHPGAPADLSRAIFDADPLAPPPMEEQRASEQAVARDERATVARLIKASSIRPKAVEWLWPHRVPLGMLTLFSGDPKLGKSLATLSLVAALTRGGPLPGGGRAPRGSVIMLSAEDDFERTIAPRLISAGADMDRVDLLDLVIDPPSEGPAHDPTAAGEPRERMPTLVSNDLAAIERAAVSQGDCRLIVIDPVSAYLGECNDHRNGDVRGVLAPLKELAERLGAAVVLITHHNKNSAGGTNGKYRVLGSIAYVGACRANFLFLPDPDDPKGERVLMLDNGGNLAPKQPGLAYVIRDAEGVAVCDWQPGTVDLDADAALARAAKTTKGCEVDGRSERRLACEDWLRNFLDSGSKPAAECLAEGQKHGFQPRTVQRARERIGARNERIGFGDRGEYYWSLQEQDQSELAF